MDTLTILTDATGRGWRTSEFWLAVVALLLLTSAHSDNALAVAGIVAAYALSRSIVKASTTRALLTDVEPPLRLSESHDVRPLR